MVPLSPTTRIEKVAPPENFGYGLGHSLEGMVKKKINIFDFHEITPKSTMQLIIISFKLYYLLLSNLIVCLHFVRHTSFWLKKCCNSFFFLGGTIHRQL